MKLLAVRFLKFRRACGAWHRKCLAVKLRNGNVDGNVAGFDMTDAFLAVDWGSTNRRVYLIEDGKVIRTESDGCGILSMASTGFDAEAAAIRARFGDLSMLLAGMVGSNVGWRTAPYVSAPADIKAVAAAVMRIDERTAIIPGLSCIAEGRGDVMRGEEVQLLGAAASGMAADDAFICKPGTHCKWVQMESGRIASFTTAMNGELFALLRTHSLLKQQIDSQPTLGQAFEDGLKEGRKRDLAASLFGIRASAMLDLRGNADAASFASGLIIGADVNARLAASSHEMICLLSDATLADFYAAAIKAEGRDVQVIDSHEAFVQGIIRIQEQIA
jgi:2-dehydro-3-deoxygalactonokinase